MSHDQPLPEIISTLKQQRDELALKMHLATAEAKQEWDKLEERFRQMSASYEPTRDATADTAEKVGSAIKQVASEIIDGYDRIRKSL